MTQVSKIESRLRDLVNGPRRIEILLADKNQWNKICSAMDILGDTDLAILAYEEVKNQKLNTGHSYLIVYGILQTLFIQQDAIRHLSEILKKQMKLPKELLDIRELRNAFIGHPTEHRVAGEVYHNFISQSTLSPSGFQYLRRSESGKDEYGLVNIPEIILKQRVEVVKILEDTVKYLENEELEHRKKYRSQKLVSAFPQTLNYGFEKIGEGIRNSTTRSNIGKWGLEQTINSVEEFKKLLNDRGILEAYDMSIVPLLKDLEYPLTKLLAYLSNEQTHLSDNDAEIFKFYIEAKVHELIDLATTIDKEYESNSIL